MDGITRDAVKIYFVGGNIPVSLRAGKCLETLSGAVSKLKTIQNRREIAVKTTMTGGKYLIYQYIKYMIIH